MSTGGVKELIGDVDVVAEDFRASAVNTAALRDQSVSTAKIVSAGVTLAKINKEVGVWHGVAFTTTGATAVTTAFRTILSSAATVLAVMVDISAPCSAGATLTIEDTAGNDMVVFAHASAIKTMSSTNLTATGTFQARAFAAGDSVVGLLSDKSNELVGNIYLLTITTPT